MSTQPPLPQAFYDEFGKSADDRVWDYGYACAQAALQGAIAASPEARAGDCDAWQRWWDECRICLQNVSTELRSTGRSDARYARLLDSMPATAPRLATIDLRPVTTKATP